MSRRALSIGVLVLLAFSAASWAADPEMDVRPLLRFAEGRIWKSADLPGTVAEQAVSLDPAALGAPRMRLPLLDGQTYELVRTGLERRAEGDFAWRGQVTLPGTAGEAVGSATLTMKNGSVLGRISVSGASYQIAPVADGGYRLVEVDDTRLDRCAVRNFGGSGFSREVSQMAEPVQVPLRPDLAKAKPPKVPPMTTLPLLIVYTEPAAQRLGGFAELERWVRSDVDLGNTSFENSKIPIRVDLVGMVRVNYQETGDPYTDLTVLRMSNQIDNLRREYGATHVILIVAQMDTACGIGDLMRKDKYLDRTRPFQGSAVVRSTCLGGFTLVHEIGHTLAAEHDPDWGSPAQIALFPHAYGHIVDGNFRTVMAYPNSCFGGCPTAPYFSNPAVRFDGVPTGIARRRDNAQVLGVTRARFTGPPADGCVPGPITMCLGEGRFKAEVEFLDTNVFQLGFAKTLKGTDTTGYFAFRDAASPDVAVRVTPDGNRVQVSYGQLTYFPFELTISDLHTGGVSQYYDTADTCGRSDPNAFTDVMPAASVTGAAKAKPAGGCRSTGDTLCLHGRFQVTVDWKNPNGEGRAGVATVSRLAGSFDFGDGGDPELVVKISPNGKRNFDVFYSALSTQQYTLTVTDLRTRAAKTYENPAGRFCGGNEAPAF